MIEMTKEERQLKIFLAISAMTYLVVGLAFAIMPVRIFEAFNVISRILTPGLKETPLSAERFWLSLAFSMMMTIAAL